MPWGAAIGAAASLLGGGPSAARPTEEPTCDGCGAPLRPGAGTCAHCQRPRRGAQPSPGYHWPEHRPDASPPHFPIPDLTPAPAPYYAPAPVVDWTPSPAPAPDYSSGGGGDFGGGGASGEF